MSLTRSQLAAACLGLLSSQGVALSLHKPAAEAVSLAQAETVEALETPPDWSLVPENPTYISDPKTRVITQNPTLESQQADIFMRYMPEEHAVMCGCGKCGSTSMLEYTYNQLFPTTWKDTWVGKGPPYVQEVLSERWEDTFAMVEDKKEQEKIMEDAYTFALIRDPKERYVSAWKSKLACETKLYGVDDYDRAAFDPKSGTYHGFVASVQRLRGADENITCMPLEMFAEALVDIKKKDRLQYLDRHFLPQHLGCFYRFGPSKWSKVTTIGDADAFDQLAKKLGSTNTTVPAMHSSHATAFVSQRTADLLDEVTKDEYAMLGPYLTEKSSVVAGANV